MKRLAILALLVGCTDQPTNLDEASRPKTDGERIFHDDVLPMLAANCVSCHAGSEPLFDVAFLAGDNWKEIRETLLASAVVDLLEPTSSRILTKGAHSGPHMTNADALTIITWLEAERD